MSGSLFESNDLAMSAVFSEYKHQRPMRVFEPAYATLQRRQRDILVPRKKYPWLISAYYNSPTLESYKSLRLQREQKMLLRQQKLSKMKRRKKIAKSEASHVDDAMDEDEEDGSPQQRLGGRGEVEVLRGIFEKFDHHKNGWVENADIPRMIAAYCGHQKPQTSLANTAILKITSYSAVEFNDFLEVVVTFVEDETLELGDSFEAAGLETAGLEDVRKLLLATGDEFFTWAIQESIAVISPIELHLQEARFAKDHVGSQC
jgi:Ca2+-binding EF-hand superfamily protein